MTTTPWADNLAKRTAESQDLFPPQDKPLIRPDRRPKPSPVQLGRPTPTPTPQPITPPEPDATPFMDRMLQKAGATALDFITSQGQQTVNALGNLSELTLGSRNPLDVPRDIPRQAKHAFGESMLALDASQEALLPILGPELSSLLGEGLAWENIKRNPLLPGGRGRLLSEITTEPKSFMEFLRSRPSEFKNRLEQNREAHAATEEVFDILIHGGMNPYEAGEALEAIFQTRPISTQIGTSIVDPFMLPGAVRGAAQTAKILAKEAPIARLAFPEIAQAAGREPFEDVLDALLKARNHGEARRIIEGADASNLPALREAIDTMDPKLAAVNRARVVLDRALTPTEQIRTTPQVPALEGMTPLGLADEPPLVAPGTTVQPDLGGELAGAGGPRQVSMLDLGTGARAEQVPLIDEAEIATQAAERARLAEEAAAGQERLGLVDVVDEVPLAADIAGVAPTTPIRFDPATNNYNVPLQRGDLLTDASRNIYRLERQSGFILEVDAQRPNGSFAPFGSFSVDPGDVDRYRPLFKEISPPGITPEDIPLVTPQVPALEGITPPGEAITGIRRPDLGIADTPPAQSLEDAIANAPTTPEGINLPDLELLDQIHLRHRIKTGPPMFGLTDKPRTEVPMGIRGLFIKYDIRDLNRGSDILEVAPTIARLQEKRYIELTNEEINQVFAEAVAVRQGSPARGDATLILDRLSEELWARGYRPPESFETRLADRVAGAAPTPIAKRTRKPRKKLPARAEAELKGYLGEQEYNRRFNLGEFHGERVGKDPGVPMGLRQAQEEVLNLSQQQTTGTGTPQPFLDRPGTGQLFQGDTDVARGIEAVPGEEFAARYGITDPEDIATISRIGPGPLRVMEDGANQLEQIRLRDRELDLEVAKAQGDGDKAALHNAVEAKNDLLDEQRDIAKKMWDNLEELGVNRRTGGVQNLLGNLRKNIQEAAEDAEQVVARELLARQELTPAAAAPSPAAGVPEAAAEELVYYRGTDPVRLAQGERIRTGDTWWDEKLFVTKTEEGASQYGPDIERIVFKPDSKILREGTAEFVGVAGRWRKGESMFDFARRAAKEAEDAGYDAVHFKRQADIGTVVLNRSAIVRQEAAAPSPAAAAPSPAAVPEAGAGRYIQQEEDAIIRGQQSIDEMKAEVARFFGPNPEANPNPSIRASFSNRQGEIRSAEEALQRRSDELQAIRAEEAAPSPADEIQQALEQRAIDEAGLSTVELAELRVEEARAINTAIDSAQKIIRPPRSAGLWGFNRDMLIEIAQQEGRDPTKPDWWDAMDKVLIRSFRKEHSSGGARSRVRTKANAAEREAREQLEQAQIDTGKSHEAAVKAAKAPIPDKTLKTPVKDPTVTSLLPQDLRRSKPRYRDQQIEFEDDLDKALYIVAAIKPSLGEPKFLKWINEVTGLDTVQAKAQGKLIRAEIKKLYTGDQETPIFLKSTVTRPKIKPPTPAPIPTHTLLNIGDEITVNGIESFMSDSRSIDGSRYEMFTPVDVGDTRGFIRVINEATGEIITENATETIDEAMTQWEQIMDLAYTPGTGGIGTPSISAADGPPISPPTEVGGVGGIPPDAPPPVNAAGEPFDGDLVDKVLTWFKRFLADPARAGEWDLTLQWRRRALQGRLMTAREHMGQLIAGGMDEGEAARRVRADLAGEFPRPQTGPVGLHEIAGPEIRAALENKIAQSLDTILEGDFLEMQATLKALDNALQGKAIPDIPGSLGRSAKTRLQRVFGDEIVEALDTPQDLETIIALRQERTVKRSAKIQDDLAPGEFPPDRPYPYPEETALSPIQRPLDPELPGPKLGTTPDRRTDFEKKLALAEFGQILRKQYSKFPDSTARTSHPPGEIPPETWIQQWELMPDPDRHLLMRAAKLAGLTLIDFGNFLKANLASVDFSFWRQQQPLIFGNLDAFAKGNVKAFKSIWTQAYAEKVMGDINSHPEMALYDELDIDFLRPLSQEPEVRMVGKFDPRFQGSDIDLPGVTSTVPSVPGRQRIVGGVEEFGLFGRERPIQRLTAALPWVRISGRAHIIGTNAMNWKIFTTFMEQQRKVERGIAEGKIILKPGESFDIKREAKLMGTMLEDMSGRAQLPEALTKLTPAMNAGFFSMRLNIGRLIMGRHLFSKSPAVRKAAMKNIVTSVVGFSAIILAGKQQGLWDVELDPRSSDFMVIRIGKIRIDPWGGARQFVTFFARMMPIAAAMESLNIPGADRIPISGTKSTTTGQINPNFGTVPRMFRSKAAPLATLVIDTWTGKNFLGEPVDNLSVEQWAERVAPLAVQDIYEAFQEQGGWSATASAAAIVGAGVLVYDLPRWPDLDEYYMIKATKLQSTSARRSRYRQRNPLQEARLFVRGDVTTLSTIRARNLALDIMSEHDVDPKDVRGYSKQFKDKPVPEGRSVSQEEKDRLKANQDRVAGRSTSQQPLSISVQEELRRLAAIAAGDPVLTK